MKMFNQGTSKPEASNEKVSGDMASEWEELVELDDVQLATVVGGWLDAYGQASEIYHMAQRQYMDSIWQKQQQQNIINLSRPIGGGGYGYYY